VTTVPTVEEFRAMVANVRAVRLRWAAGTADAAEVTEAVEQLLAAIRALPDNVMFATKDLLDQVVSRALVEKAYQVLNEGPGSAGIGRSLALLREALGR
jgi:hypothetical protein